MEIELKTGTVMVKKKWKEVFDTELGLSNSV